MPGIPTTVSSYPQVPPALEGEGRLRGSGSLGVVLRMLPTTDGLVHSEWEIKAKWFFLADSLEALV